MTEGAFATVLDNYSPFGALLTYIHPEAVQIVPPGKLKPVYFQFDGKKFDANSGEDVAYAECVLKQPSDAHERCKKNG